MVFPMLKMYKDPIVFSMKEYLFFFFMISYIEEFGLLFSKIYVLFFQNISLSYFFWTSDGHD